MTSFRSLERHMGARSLEELRLLLSVAEAFYAELDMLGRDDLPRFKDRVEELMRDLTLEISRRPG